MNNHLKTDKRRSSAIHIEPITAAGGVVIQFREQESQPQVLLIYRRGVWDLPKGKQEETETIKECAGREVAEEIGIDEHPEIITDLIETYHEYEQGGTYFGKTTHWYAMKLSSPNDGFSPQTKEGIQKVEWFLLGEAKKHLGYPNLVDVLESLSARLSDL